MPYYGVYIPVKGGATVNTTNTIVQADSSNDVHGANNETDTHEYVFQDKSEALKVLKQHKDARFKEFISEEEATRFSQTGFEIVQNKYNDVKTPTESLAKAAFKVPTRQELIRFRESIEHDNWKGVKKIIWENPRYLVSSGDTPTILKEGYRYNAMHVCAISRCPNVAKLILDTISDLKFADLLMGKKSEEKLCKELCANLLDYYLNIPEKGRNETPLHFAAKYGHLEIVAILTSYPECKMLRNSQGLTPRYIICQRCDNKIMYTEILKFLEDRYYVPVLRCNDSSIPGQIGEPFLASNPPAQSSDPLTPEVEIKALAGPMSQDQAKKFFRRWKTPPRLGSIASSPIANNPFISPIKSRNITPTKLNYNLQTASLQKRSLCNSTPQHYNNKSASHSNGFDNSISEDSYDIKHSAICETETNEVDFASKSETNNNNELLNPTESQINVLKPSLCPGTPLFKLKSNAFSIYRDQNFASPLLDSISLAPENDSLLNVSDIYDTPSFKERHVKNTDIEKGLECIGRCLAKENYIEWSEYWDFLEEFVDIASEEGMKKLENFLSKRQKELEQHNNKSEIVEKPDLIDDVCNALETAFRSTALPSTTTAANRNTSITNQSSTPYTYVEKSLQVHARRMTKTIIHNIDNETSIIDALLLELRRVKSLIYSFKEDSSYVNVNFEKVHSRIGNLVAMFLENSQEVSKQMKWNILIILQKILEEQGDRREHMECVCSRIFEALQHPTEQTLPENVKTEELCSQIWSEEKDCDCQWESNLSRKTSHRNRMEARYKNYQRIKQQEKIQKDIDNQHKVFNKEKDKRYMQDDVKNDSSDEDEFWSDFGGSDSDENEIFLTPRESPSRLDSSDEADNDNKKIFIYGNEPTKRDLDVLNAIFHINIDKTKYPNIYTWKSTITRFSNEEMEFFPSPRTVKKSHSFIATSFVQPQKQTSTPKAYSFVRSNTSSIILNSSRQQSQFGTASATSLTNLNVGIIRDPILQLPTAKRLFISPGRTKSMTAISAENKTNDDALNTITTVTAASLTGTINMPQLKIPLHQQLGTQRPLTPLNKLRGLFSAYRECPTNSPLSTSSTSP